MRIEADVTDDATNGDKSFNLTCEIGVTEEQRVAFNAKMKGKVFLRPFYSDKSQFVEDVPCTMLLAHWEEEDPDEDLSPFTEKKVAEDYLKELWQFCGGSGQLNIEEREQGPILSPATLEVIRQANAADEADAQLKEIIADAEQTENNKKN